MRALGLALFALLFVRQTDLVSLAPKARPQKGYSPPAKKLDFDKGDQVTTDRKVPEAPPVVVAPPVRHRSLLKLRQDFGPEMLKTAEEL